MTTRFHVELELAFAWQPCATSVCQANQATNATVFELLESYEFTATAHEVGAKAERDLLRLEAKLDLVIQLLRRVLEQQQVPEPLVPLRLAPTELAWCSKSEVAVGSTVQLVIYLDPRLPQPIYLCGHVAANDAGWVIVTLLHPDEANTDAWQRWLFRQHRHQIARLRNQHRT